jgi:RNA polymerase sigma-70 factor (ECF subfamily)
MEALVQAFSETVTESTVRLDFLGDCMQGLDETARELCRLRYELDMKPATIAVKLGTTANNVAKSLQRVRDRLRDCIEHKTRALESGL